MKISKYISIFEKEHMVYNALNNSLIRLNNDLFEMFKQGEIRDCIINKYPNEIKELKLGMFLLNDHFDELQYIKFVHTHEKFQSNSLSLTISPTLDCNFSCYYCVQDITLKKDGNDMTMETAHDILTFVEENHKKNALKVLNITWYGGEPLLKFDIVKYLSEKIKEFTTNNNISYNGSIITNGYLLNYDYAKFLSNNNVNTVQITIDGPKEIHDKRRRHKDNSETYEIIMKNIKNVANLFKNIIIRFNVDKTNIKYFSDLENEINTNLNKFSNITLYMAPIVSDTLSNCNFSNSLYSFEEFAKIRYQNRDIISKTLYPKLSYGACGATKINSFVIKPNGDLCKCWNEVSQENTEIRDLKSSMTNISRFIKWVNYDPTEIEKCKNCEILPICMGGSCPYRVVFPQEMNASIECNEYKYLLKEYILGWLEIKNNNKKTSMENNKLTSN